MAVIMVVVLLAAVAALGITGYRRQLVKAARRAKRKQVEHHQRQAWQAMIDTRK